LIHFKKLISQGSLFALLLLISLITFKANFPNAFVYAELSKSNAECPPTSENIWVRLDTYGPGDGSWVNIPFDSGYDNSDIDGDGPDIATGYINYLTGVLITEVGTTSQPPEEGVTIFDSQ
jgi:hypothetical protein